MLKKISWNFHRLVFNRVSDALKKHKKLYYIERVLRHYKDDLFVDSVLNINRDENTIHINMKNHEKINDILYYIRIEQYGMGMGAFLRWALHGIWEADRYNWLPVVEFCGVYNEDNPINNSKNMFEYYFRQPSDFNLQDLKKRTYFLFDEGALKRHASFYNMSQSLLVGYDINERYIKDMGDVAKKYLHLNDATKACLEKDIGEMLGSAKKVIGVHIRGTDYKMKWKHHPLVVRPEQYYEYIDSFVEDGYDNIFLATDDLDYLRSFQERYGERLLYYKDVNRGDDMINIAMANADRPTNNYLNGLEVLRDIYTLASCDVLIAGLSQVSVTARIINRSMDKVYDECVIINNGIV